MAELLLKLLLMDMFEGEAYWQVVIYLKEYAPELHDEYLKNSLPLEGMK